MYLHYVVVIINKIKNSTTACWGRCANLLRERRRRPSRQFTPASNKRRERRNKKTITALGLHGNNTA